MIALDFTLSLRVFHPNIDPAAISSALGLTPERSWRAGDPRRTPAGTSQGGANDETYCLFVIVNEKDGDLGDCVAKALERLAQHAVFFLDLRKSGGRAEFSVFCFPSGGAVLAADSLSRLGGLGLDLELMVEDGDRTRSD